VTIRVPRFLLPLLLCLSLIAATVGSAWMATAIAMPAQGGTAQSMEHGCCAGQDLHAHTGGDHGQPATPGCGDGTHCDCMQHCQLLPAPTLVPLAALRFSPRATLPHLPRREVLLERLNRPPIA